MKEMVLYYNPGSGPHVAKLKGVLVRMGVRIKNISPDQVNQKVGYLAGLPGFTEIEAQPMDTEVERRPADTEIEAEPVDTEVERGPADTEVTAVSMDEEMLVMKNFTSRRMDELLMNLRKAGVPRIALKAVITEQNSHWTFRQLYRELKEEHKTMTGEG
ncbi:MAG: DUF3783 domain-containing protein [Hungatella sp.]|nr:DUF3783 domain-containing protein [Hungatella sp.]